MGLAWCSAPLYQGTGVSTNGFLGCAPNRRCSGTSSAKSGAVTGPVAATEEMMQISLGKAKKSWKGAFAVNGCIPTSLLEER